MTMMRKLITQRRRFAPPTNTAAPTITGTVQVNQTLVISLGSWTGTPTLVGELRYASNNAVIAVFVRNGTYIPVLADVGKALYLHVTAINAAGSVTAQSANTSAVRGYDAAVLATQAAALVSYLKLNETSGSTAADASGNSRTGVYGAGVTLNSVNFLDGLPAPKVTTTYIDWYTNSLRDAWTPELFTVVAWAKPTAATWSDGTLHSVFTFYPSGNYHTRIYIQNNVLTLLYRVNGVNYSQTVAVNTLAPWYTGWIQLAITVNRAQNRARMYMNGEQVGSDLTGFAAWTGALLSTLTAIGAQGTSGAQGWGQHVARVALWNTELSAVEIAALYSTVITDKNVLIVGDSKSGSSQAWRYLLRQSLYDEGKRYTDLSPDYAIGGYTVAQMRTYVEANLSSASFATPNVILINLGANDVGALPDEATWNANYTAIIDAFRAKYPGVPIHIVLLWRQGYDSACATAAARIASIVASYSSGVYVGHNEQVWLKGADNGATNTTDGTHYSTAGQIAAAAQWAAIL